MTVAKTVTKKDIEKASKNLKGVAKVSPLDFCKRLSDKYGANIYLKREDTQEVRSFKIRGAYNFISGLSDEEKSKGVVCASAGNHAQGVAYSCNKLGIKGTIFMPIITPEQKVKKVTKFAGKWAEIKLVGDNFDEASKLSKEFCEKEGSVYVHPFDAIQTIAGQGTIGKEVWEQTNGKVDYVFCQIGGGGLISGIATYLKEMNSNIKIVGVESVNQPSMHDAIQKGEISTLDQIDTFLDGTAVKTPGNLTFDLVQKYVDKIILVEDGRVCAKMVSLYQNEGIITEPSGALSTAGIKLLLDEIKGKNVVSIISGGNNDILRYPEILEKALVYKGLKHYFIVEFAQKPGQLKRFLDEVLSPSEDIVRFEYIKKTNKEKGPALVGLELENKEDLKPLLERFDEVGITYKKIDSNDPLYELLV